VDARPCMSSEAWNSRQRMRIWLRGVQGLGVRCWFRVLGLGFWFQVQGLGPGIRVHAEKHDDTTNSCKHPENETGSPKTRDREGWRERGRERERERARARERTRESAHSG
jgi:hypothetical protein